MVSIPAVTPVTTPPATLAEAPELRQVPPVMLGVMVIVALGQTVADPDNVPASVAGLIVITWKALAAPHVPETL